eukprot:3941963-Rhodomonas_salina.6
MRVWSVYPRVSRSVWSVYACVSMYFVCLRASVSVLICPGPGPCAVCVCVLCRCVAVSLCLLVNAVCASTPSPEPSEPHPSRPHPLKPLIPASPQPWRAVQAEYIRTYTAKVADLEARLKQASSKTAGCDAAAVTRCRCAGQYRGRAIVL